MLVLSAICDSWMQRDPFFYLITLWGLLCIAEASISQSPWNNAKFDSQGGGYGAT